MLGVLTEKVFFDGMVCIPLSHCDIISDIMFWIEQNIPNHFDNNSHEDKISCSERFTQ
jgi:hypothetical protein